MPESSAAMTAAARAPSVQIYLLSPFRVFVNDRAVDDWPAGKGKAIFKYLAMHRSQPVPREVLMDVFWPAASQEAARNNLNVAVYGLRKALAQADTDAAFVLFRQGCYRLNPALRLWLDAEAFVDHLHRAQVAEQRGDEAGAIADYQVAQALYRNALLEEDRFEDWPVPQRQSLQADFMRVLQRLCAHHFDAGDFEACVAVCTRRLEVDRCDEDAHCLLMRCYSRMGHAHLALRQYHFCVDALARELKLIPGPQTVALFHTIRQRQAA
jgi:DNA-binding SARP family transcriptional activator